VSWPIAWGAVLLFALVAFAGVALAIAVRGRGEIRELFAALDEETRRKKG
jgi:hypothetical protein